MLYGLELTLFTNLMSTYERVTMSIMLLNKKESEWFRLMNFFSMTAALATKFFVAIN